MPFEERKTKGRIEKRFLRHNHLSNKPWLAYSHVKNGLFCKICLLFGTQQGQQGHKLGRLVHEPLKKYARLLGPDGPLYAHEHTNYHKDNVLRAHDFKRMVPQQHIDSRLTTQRQEQIAKNKHILSSIVRAILVCGRSGYALRGHRDDHGVLATADQSGQNDGLFREIIRAIAETGDTRLEEHLRSGPGNAKYTSKTIQNELILCIGEVILDRLKVRINNA